MLQLIFFLSGAAGLIYQVLWVREFGNLFGNTFQSASIVVGIFVFNLGIGSYLGGILVDKLHSKEKRIGLIGYIGAEVLIAAFGLALAFIIPLLEPLSVSFSAYTVAENGWHELSTFSYLARYVLATLLLFGPTLLMGATLTFLIRFVLDQDLSAAGWHIGRLYGANTLGAAAGCLLVDFWAIPAIGLQSTKLVAVLLNLAAAYLSYKLFIKNDSNPVRVGIKDVETKSLFKGFSKHLTPSLAGAAIFISGFAAMGFEIVWFRHLTTALSGTRATFSLLLGIILIGMWIGATLGGRLTKRSIHPAWIYFFSQIGLIFTALGLLYSFTLINHGNYNFYIQENARNLGDWAWAFTKLSLYWPVPFTVFIPAIFMGFAFPVANAILQKNKDDIGQTAGHIYVWNATGSLLGSLVAGFLLLPNLGTQNSFTVLAIVAFIALIPIGLILYKDSQLSNGRVIWLNRTAKFVTLCCIGIFVTWLSQPPLNLLRTGFVLDPQVKGEKILAVSEGILESVVVTARPLDLYGEKPRRLYTNGHPMSGTSFNSARYMRAFAHIPLLQIDEPTDVLIICFGVGNTANATSRHPSIKNIEIADISKNVLSHAQYFEMNNENVLKDPRVNVFVNDGRQHLRMQPANKFDLVTLEPPPLKLAGVASLYGVEFYELARKALKPGGYVSQWWPAYQLTSDMSKSLIRAFIDVFPNAVLLHGSEKEFILVGQKDGNNIIDPDKFLANLEKRPKVLEDMKRINFAEPAAIAGAFVNDSDNLHRIVENYEPISDDYPIIEYNPKYFRDLLDPKFFNVSGFKKWCPTCDRFEDLVGYLKIMQSIYWSFGFADMSLDKKHRASLILPKVEVSPEEVKYFSEKYPYMEKIIGLSHLREHQASESTND